MVWLGARPGSSWCDCALLAHFGANPLLLWWKWGESSGGLLVCPAQSILWSSKSSRNKLWPSLPCEISSIWDSSHEKSRKLVWPWSFMMFGNVWQSIACYPYHQCNTEERCSSWGFVFPQTNTTNTLKRQKSEHVKPHNPSQPQRAWLGRKRKEAVYTSPLILY